MNSASEPVDWIGRWAERRIRITAEMLDQFTAISGDSSAIHVSDEAAKQRGFPGRVAHGMLLGALVSGIVGTELPGDDGVLQEMKLSFRTPCHPEDVITIRLTVTEFFESVQTMLIKVKILNTAGATVATGLVQSGLRPR